MPEKREWSFDRRQGPMSKENDLMNYTLKLITHSPVEYNEEDVLFQGWFWFLF